VATSIQTSRSRPRGGLGFPRAEGSPPDPARGVFETLLASGTEALELEPHLRRLAESVRTLYGASLPPLAPARLERLLDAAPLARVRIAFAPAGSTRDALELDVRPVEPSLLFPSHERALTLQPVVLRGGLGPHKWSDRDLVGAAEAATAPALPLLVEEDGGILEASRGNVFALVDGKLVTPPLDGRILPGVTRSRVLRLASELGIPTRERLLSLDELADAEELFVTGAVRGVEPVGRCWTWQARAEGEATRLLARSLRRLWLREERAR
jgi:para-aminobenzoate synthetase / 4-amino-4-deoxychorismate lyase